jgi:hypothetical protein
MTLDCKIRHYGFPFFGNDWHRAKALLTDYTFNEIDNCFKFEVYDETEANQLERELREIFDENDDTDV